MTEAASTAEAILAGATTLAGVGVISVAGSARRVSGAGKVGEWTSAGMFQSTRGMAVTGLTPGGTYNFRVRAVGGSTGYSEWSNPVGRMSL